MIIGFAGQSALPCSAFEQPLCQSDAGGNAVAAHLVDGHGVVSVYVALVGVLGRAVESGEYEESRRQ